MRRPYFLLREPSSIHIFIFPNSNLGAAPRPFFSFALRYELYYTFHFAFKVVNALFKPFLFRIGRFTRELMELTVFLEGLFYVLFQGILFLGKVAMGPLLPGCLVCGNNSYFWCRPHLTQ
jgi:hypothetical protein